MWCKFLMYFGRRGLKYIIPLSKRASRLQKFGDVVGGRRRRLLTAVGLVAVAVPLFFVLANARQARAQSQAQNTAVVPPTYEYEVASFKLDKSDGFRASLMTEDNGLTGLNVSLQWLIESAYGVRNYQVSGAPNWLDSERYDIDAKMDGSVADELKKLGPDERNLAREHMLQVLLADRLKLKIHRESKELPVYLLVITKNGSKLQGTRPDETAPGESRGSGDHREAGSMRTVGNRVSQMMTAKAVPIADLARNLSGSLGRPVLDKTGLTGKYDFKLTWASDDIQTDSNAPSLFAAVQEQLGLKLESGKRPVEVIVIDHVEKPSGN